MCSRIPGGTLTPPFGAAEPQVRCERICDMALAVATLLLPSATPDGLAAFWDFSSHAPFVDSINGYTLLQHNASDAVEVVPDATRGAALQFRSGQRLYAPREAVPKLASIAGPNATVTVVARPLTAQASWDQVSCSSPARRASAHTCPGKCLISLNSA